MYKKGFTLVELMSVIIILGILSLIIVPIVDKSIKNGKQKLYDAQIKTIELAAKDWVSSNAIKTPKNNGESITLTVLQLKAAGKLDFNLVDPITEKMFSENLEITITRNSKNYVYDVIDKDISGNTYLNEATEFNRSTPIIELNGNNIIYHTLDATYVEPGCVAKDYNGNLLTCSTTAGSTVNVNLAGSYVLTYEATNAGITTNVKRTVIVK
jgi:prepilin-type N-terminal cleavage/methylation domain-containing protein